MKTALMTLAAFSGLLLTAAPAGAFNLEDVANTAAKASKPKPAAENSALVSQLASELGITPAQAGGGAAAILGEARKNMKPEDFSRLTEAVPEIASLLKTDTLAALGQNLSLSRQFAALGLDSAMVGQFTPIVLGYVKQLAGPEVSQLLAAAL